MSIKLLKVPEHCLCSHPTWIPWKMAGRKKRALGYLFVTKAKKQKATSVQQWDETEASFRKRAWHSCTTFSHPPDPLERKEDLREDRESQCLFPAVGVRGRKWNKTEKERRLGGRKINTHVHPRTQANTQRHTHTGIHTSTYTQIPTNTQYPQIHTQAGTHTCKHALTTA